MSFNSPIYFGAAAFTAAAGAAAGGYLFGRSSEKYSRQSADLAAKVDFFSQKEFAEFNFLEQKDGTFNFSHAYTQITRATFQLNREELKGLYGQHRADYDTRTQVRFKYLNGLEIDPADGPPVDQLHNFFADKIETMDSDKADKLKKMVYYASSQSLLNQFAFAFTFPGQLIVANPDAAEEPETIITRGEDALIVNCSRNDGFVLIDEQGESLGKTLSMQVVTTIPFNHPEQSKYHAYLTIKST